ncbi:MAG: hypothetical protein A2745_02275 [Candidatus Harrisonbacteria bacterium RIFCSPHIGHO2_01_FULL_44_13]|uniref:Uncharacterized protein n=1 Tax=Candidatus Harrisonbacteria bacterium RIFCSPLOWO2_01_FULL_44_18 TaxID=1798407 RepID=A0A1G1ZP01_9BACT|nr:MAG: hypothetical protein A2745_02275 [Candidatus Harrisonbacteria bacterium RIFCSPHIGHO2_01_FULL_44_13]OGY66159.1 MAG: hypothetical protein A3A16_02540 [Candidatus Harrisonbacteria bacterium RIFCSPLOWO2_01_FULL_44_18]
MNFEKEPKSEENRNLRFRQLVENLVEKSGLFEPQIGPSGPDGKMTILDAIEKNQLPRYMEKYKDDKKRVDAMYSLLEIYDGLGKENPDEDVINETMRILKEYL